LQRGCFFGYEPPETTALQFTPALAVSREGGFGAEVHVSCRWDCLCPAGHSSSIASEHLYLACQLLLWSEGYVSFRGWVGRKPEARILLTWVDQPAIASHIIRGLLCKAFL